MLLDDNVDIVQVVEEVLLYEQFEVMSITQSAGFFAIAEEFRPDLIILDYRLSDGNGGEICREVKAHPKLKHTPVMIFSAYTQPGLDLKKFGCNAVMSKPFDLDELLETVNSLIRPGATPYEETV